MPATRGWTQCGSLTLDALAGSYAQAGLRHLLCNDIARDGMLAGPNLGLYAQLRAWAPDLSLQASGGARDMADLRAAAKAGCAGIVLGRPPLEGRISPDSTLACCAAPSSPPWTTPMVTSPRASRLERK